MSRVAVVAVLAVAGVIAGCGETVIDEAKLEDTVQQSLEGSQGKAVKAVECPSDPEVDPGATFTCTVQYSGGEGATATLKIRNEDADLSLIDLRPDK